jgi:outer membrane biosynthesis protein TonB
MPDDDQPAAGGPDAGPDQAGEVPMDQVKVEMEAVRDEIRANCAATTAFAGVTKVMITIRPDGTATAEIESSSGMPDVDQCVLDSISSSQFSTSSRGQRFHYSFTFK